MSILDQDYELGIEEQLKFGRFINREPQILYVYGDTARSRTKSTLSHMIFDLNGYSIDTFWHKFRESLATPEWIKWMMWCKDQTKSRLSEEYMKVADDANRHNNTKEIIFGLIERRPASQMEYYEALQYMPQHILLLDANRTLILHQDSDNIRHYIIKESPKEVFIIRVRVNIGRAAFEYIHWKPKWDDESRHELTNPIRYDRVTISLIH